MSAFGCHFNRSTQHMRQIVLPVSRSLTFSEDALGPDHPDVGATLDSYADLLRKTGRYQEAAAMEIRAKAVRAKHAE